MRREKCAGVAQLAEQLICNQQVGGSNPSTSSTLTFPLQLNMGEFPSGQRGQTVNLLSLTSVVRIHLPPPSKRTSADVLFALSGGTKSPPDRGKLWIRKPVPMHICTLSVGGGTWQSQRPLDAPPHTIPIFFTGGETPPLRVMQESPFSVGACIARPPRAAPIFSRTTNGRPYG